jgi:hypothetical protein
MVALSRIRQAPAPTPVPSGPAALLRPRGRVRLARRPVRRVTRGVILVGRNCGKFPAVAPDSGDAGLAMAPGVPISLRLAVQAGQKPRFSGEKWAR